MGIPIVPTEKDKTSSKHCKSGNNISYARRVTYQGERESVGAENKKSRNEGTSTHPRTPMHIRSDQNIITYPPWRSMNSWRNRDTENMAEPNSQEVSQTSGS